MERFGEVLSFEMPRIKIRVARGTVPEVLGNILASQTVLDVSVEDPPLEEVIAALFSYTDGTKE